MSISTKVVSVEINKISPIEREKLLLSPALTIVRGSNGAGKTTFLEALALLGHVSVIEPEAALFERSQAVQWIKLEVEFRRHDPREDGAENDSPLPDELAELLTMHEQFKDGDSAAFRADVMIGPPVGVHVTDLKFVLQDESTLASWKWWCRPRSGGDELELVRFITRLTEFSRPRRNKSEREVVQEELDRRHRNIEVLATELHGAVGTIDAGKGTRIDVRSAALAHVEELQAKLRAHPPGDDFQAALRSARGTYVEPPRMRLLEEDLRLPGFVSYVNTDMYHWGLGLDIRESPKSMRDEIGVLLRERFFLFKDDGEMRNLDRIKAVWSEVFYGPEQLQGVRGAVSADGAQEYTIRVGDERDQGRDFLSSGENQIFMMGVVLGALKPHGSVIALDEPDLHMSLTTARRFYDMLYHACIVLDLQLVMVTHLPLMPVGRLADELDFDALVRDCLDARETVAPIGSLEDCILRRPQLVALHALIKTKSGEGVAKLELTSQHRALEKLADDFSSALEMLELQVQT